MKLKSIGLGIFIFLQMLNLTTIAQTMDIISYNIRYNNPNDGADQWENRKQDVVQLLKTHQPSAFGVQEATDAQMNYLKNALSQYAAIGVGRDDGKTKGEYSAIFYKIDELELLAEGTFWLSPTPNEVSKGWDAALPRICTYAQFKHLQSGKTFWHFNTHFDHRGEEARTQSARLIAQKIQELTAVKAYVVITGDFNATPEDVPIQVMKNSFIDPLDLTHISLIGPYGTFSGFDLDAPLQNRIDYIFMRGFVIDQYVHLGDKRPNGRWVSDHLPVKATLIFN